MPKLFPSDPRWPDDHGAERAVWRALRDQLPDPVVLFHGVCLQEGPKEREIDLLVAWPGVGLAAIEVKGGQIQKDSDGWWQRSRTGGWRPIDPVRQVQDAKHLLQRQLRNRWPRFADVPMAHLVAFPWREVPAEWDSAQLSRTMMIDKLDLATPRRVADRVLRAINGWANGAAPLSDDQVDSLVGFVAAQLPPEPEAVTAAAQHDAIAEQLTEEQRWVLDLLGQQRRVRIIGAAGAGKTWLALEKARRLSRAGEKVALMCYSRGLGRQFQRVVSGWPKHDRPAYVGLFHDLPTSWGAPVGPDDEPAWWERDLPAMLGDLARQREAGELFDSVIIDEGQDFGAVWWDSLLCCLRDRDCGGLYVFMDDDQRVFPRRGDVPIDLPPFPLRRSIRSTKPIAWTFGALTHTQVDPAGAHGDPVRVVDVPERGAVSTADDAVEALMDEGWRPGQIALLTTGRRHPEQRLQIESDGPEGYWDAYFAANDVFYGTVLNFKGLERSVVVLAVNGIHSDTVARPLLYTGMSRAKSLLVVVGDRAEIERIGGPAVVHRLGKAQEWQPSDI